MRPQFSSRKILSSNLIYPVYFRKFLLHSLALNGLLRPTRPELGFLHVRMRRPAVRLISTETKEWLKYEVQTGLKYSIIITVTGFFLIIMASGIQEEYRARIYPSPDEWNWNTRIQFRAARAREDSDDPWMKNWVSIGNSYKNVIKKLEDQSGEGQGIYEQVDNIPVIPVKTITQIGYDISQKSEAWRRGYYEVLMGLARVAEQLDNHVKNKTKISNLAWPANSVYSPSNPRPRPVPVGMPPSPKVEDCVAAFEAPDVFYSQILTTFGLTEKQKVDAAISYGLWLDFKGMPALAQKIYEWAVDKANSDLNIVNPSTGIINNYIGTSSENILTATTALALHHATHSNVELALPMFVSILRARKSLPEPPTSLLSSLNQVEEDSEPFFSRAITLIRKYAKPPTYPQPPSDGTESPYRDAKGRCEEAGIMLYIGEILFATMDAKSSQENGIAWTREAVDAAEHELGQKQTKNDARQVCKQCLEVGLQNWSVMVEKLGREEEQKMKSLNQSWLKFGNQKPDLSRWEREKEVIQSRFIRASGFLKE
ncbi:hypothetical protein HI914_00989 [Erysiphe necator]|nr:hypothetical protein HI914_00989 [Erysiphe necator]